MIYTNRPLTWTVIYSIRMLVRADPLFLEGDGPESVCLWAGFLTLCLLDSANYKYKMKQRRKVRLFESYQGA